MVLQCSEDANVEYAERFRVSLGFRGGTSYASPFIL